MVAFSPVALGLLTLAGLSTMASAQSNSAGSYSTLYQSMCTDSAVVADGTSFALNGDSVSYRFHVNETTGDLVSDHFGGSVGGAIPSPKEPAVNGWVGETGRTRREFPDQGRGDFRIPAVRIRQTAGYAVSDLQYKSHEVVEGKSGLPGLPATFGDAGDVTTLIVHLYDNYSSVAADLSYSIFPKYDAVVRSVNVTNKGEGNITIESLASLSVDFNYEDLEMISLRGDWAREANLQRSKIDYGVQGYITLSVYTLYGC